MIGHIAHQSLNAGSLIAANPVYGGTGAAAQDEPGESLETLWLRSQRKAGIQQGRQMILAKDSTSWEEWKGK